VPFDIYETSKFQDLVHTSQQSSTSNQKRKATTTTSTKSKKSKTGATIQNVSHQSAIHILTTYAIFLTSLYINVARTAWTEGTQDICKGQGIKHCGWLSIPQLRSNCSRDKRITFMGKCHNYRCFKSYCFCSCYSTYKQEAKSSKATCSNYFAIEGAKPYD